MASNLKNKTHASMLHRNHQYYAARQPKFGPYIIGETIGKGSFGKVKAALHTSTDCVVALKIIGIKEIDKSGKPEDTMRVKIKLQREIRALRLLAQHPHITRLYDVFRTHSGDTVFVLELVEGGELYDYLSKAGRLSEELARHFFQQIISAVATAHAFGVCHRDIKPENILMYEEAEDSDDELKYPEEYSYKRKGIKIGDFGLASVYHDGKHFETSCGTPNYAAPEIVKGRLYDGKEVDVWSCGVVLFSMLAGTLPFDDERLAELFQKIQSSTFAFPCEESKSEVQRIKEEKILREERKAGILRENNLPSDDSRNDGPISEAARHLICWMLATDPMKRATTDEIMSHPWMHGYSKIPLEYYDGNKEEHVTGGYMFNRGHSCFPSYLISLLQSAQEERTSIFPCMHRTENGFPVRNRIEVPTEADNSAKQHEYWTSRLQARDLYRSMIDLDIVVSLCEKFKKCSRTIIDILIQYDPTVNSISVSKCHRVPLESSRHTLVDQKLARSTVSFVPCADDVLRSTEHDIFISYAILFDRKCNRERVRMVKRGLMSDLCEVTHTNSSVISDLIPQRLTSNNIEDTHIEAPKLGTYGEIDKRHSLLLDNPSSEARHRVVDAKYTLLKGRINETIGENDNNISTKDASLRSLNSSFLKHTPTTPISGYISPKQQMILSRNASSCNTKNYRFRQPAGRELVQLSSFDMSDNKLPLQLPSRVCRGASIGESLPITGTPSWTLDRNSSFHLTPSFRDPNELTQNLSFGLSSNTSQNGPQPRLLNPAFSYLSESMKWGSNDTPVSSVHADRQGISGLGSSFFLQSNTAIIAGPPYTITPSQTNDFYIEQYILGWGKMLGWPNKDGDENMMYYRCFNKILSSLPFGITRPLFSKHTFSEENAPSLHFFGQNIPENDLAKLIPVFHNGVHFQTSTASTSKIKNVQDVQKCLYRSLVRNGFIWKVIKPYQLVAISSPCRTTNPIRSCQVKIFTRIYKLPSTQKKGKNADQQHFVVGIRLSDKVVSVFNGIPIVNDLLQTLFEMADDSKTELCFSNDENNIRQ